MVDLATRWLKIKDPEAEVPFDVAIQEARDMPLNQNGGDRKTEDGKSALYNNTEKQGTSKSYLLRRMARDFPEALDKIETGEFKSIPVPYTHHNRRTAIYPYLPIG